MRELSSEIRGRGIDITVLPLSFHEYLAFKDVKLEHPKLLSLSAARGNILRYLSEYMTGGAYPEVVRNPNIHTSLLRSYLDTIIVKDVGERFHIEPSILRAFIEYSINNYAKYLSGTKIYNYLRTLNFRLAKELPQTLLQDFNEVFALFPVEISSRSIKSKEQYPKKVYLVDNGLAQLVTRKTDYGRMMENIVFLELYRRSHCLQLIEINYWKEYGKAEGKEVDFIIRRGG